MPTCSTRPGKPACASAPPYCAPIKAFDEILDCLEEKGGTFSNQSLTIVTSSGGILFPASILGHDACSVTFTTAANSGGVVALSEIESISFDDKPDVLECLGGTPTLAG